MSHSSGNSRNLLSEGLEFVEKTDVGEICWAMLKAFLFDIQQDPILGPIVRELGDSVAGDGPLR